MDSFFRDFNVVFVEVDEVVDENIVLGVIRSGGSNSCVYIFVNDCFEIINVVVNSIFCVYVEFCFGSF